MKIYNAIKNKLTIYILLCSVSVFTLFSCTENIDESDLYTFTGEMAIDHFENNPEVFSSYLEILGMVHPSKRSASTMRELLDARGNYTIFAPTNKAIDEHLDSLLIIGEVSSKNISEIPDSVAESIVFNSIIENENTTAFATTSFLEGALARTNMNDRYINISYGNDVDGTAIIYVNTFSKIIEKDIEVENGYIHMIDRVLAPSTATVSDLIINTENLSFFGSLLELTGWNEKLLKYKDEAYDELEEAGTTYNGANGNWAGRYPEHRYFGYTVFVETDSVYESKGITDVETLKTWLQNNKCYTDASFGEDYTSEDNAINQFVAYHLLPVRLTWDRMVIFSNEKGYNNTAPNDGTKFSVNVWEYYETMGKHRRSMKITGIRNGKRINR